MFAKVQFKVNDKLINVKTQKKLIVKEIINDEVIRYFFKETPNNVHSFHYTDARFIKEENES